MIESLIERIADGINWVAERVGARSTWIVGLVVLVLFGPQLVAYAYWVLLLFAAGIDDLWAKIAAKLANSATFVAN